MARSFSAMEAFKALVSLSKMVLNLSRLFPRLHVVSSCDQNLRCTNTYPL
jgi:hypothetical protein